MVLDPLSFVKIAGSARPHALWAEFFGPYPWFYLPLAGETVAESQLPVTDIYNAFKHIVTEKIGESNNIGTMPHWGQWNISLVQFKSALGQGLVRLDKAIATSFIVNFAFKGIMYDELDDTKLLSQAREAVVIPSTFVIEGIERGIINDPVFVEHLSSKTGQRKIFFEDLARGYAIVEYIADEIFELCRQAGLRRVDIRLLKDRGDIPVGRLTRPVASQQLDNIKIKSFYGLS